MIQTTLATLAMLMAALPQEPTGPTVMWTCTVTGVVSSFSNVIEATPIGGTVHLPTGEFNGDSLERRFRFIITDSPPCLTMRDWMR